MARYSKYRRTYAPKSYPRKRWASNIFTSNSLVSLTSGSTTAYYNTTICSNASQSSVPVPVIVKFGRCKIKGDVRTDVANNNNFVSGTMYVLFCPQGTSANMDLVQQHPEYIIGWTLISLDSGNTFSFSSALKRNLNSGDSIQLLFYVNSVNSSQSVRAFNFYYNVQFWTSTA